MFINSFGINVSSTYIPSPPSGPNFGYIGIDYDFTIYTINNVDEWKFDWGDGSSSEWVSLEDSETSIVQSHSWSSAGYYFIKVKFRSDYFVDGVWSESVSITISQNNYNDKPNTPEKPLGNTVGCENIEYTFSTVGTDPKGDYLQYRFDWGDGTISDWSSISASGYKGTSTHKWKEDGEYEIKAQSRDAYRLTSYWSDPSIIYIKSDSDGDKLSDDIEENLGSNPYDGSDVDMIKINDIDHFVVLVDNKVLFYNASNRNYSNMESYDGGGYVIDEDFDKVWDYIYYPSSRTYETYVEPDPWYLQIPPIYLIFVGVICIILTIIYILVKTGYLYIYEEYVLEE